MQSLDLQVCRQARDWLWEGQGVWLCTVLHTFGSAPRGPGAMLVALASGELKGSLSGGCVEEDFIARLMAGGFDPVNQVVRYGDGGLAPTRALPCGGVLDILLEYLPAGGEANTHLAALEQALDGGELLTRSVTLGGQQRHISPGSMGQERVQRDGAQVLIRLGAVQKLLLAGWSPVAEYCATFALALGFEVVLCEPRSEVLETVELPGVEVIEVLPAVYIANGGCHRATAVVALTHDPRLDDLTLMEAVRTEAFYIGAMGSHRTSDKRRERLARVGGLAEPALQRLHAPIGLHLGSKTPAEIAIAVIADILRVANGISPGQLAASLTPRGIQRQMALQR
ncbi:XdhC family protein [Pseudomonas turukhanskensis]|nr:XdhC family protein [Pseudomonas turukhanskensis]